MSKAVDATNKTSQEELMSNNKLGVMPVGKLLLNMSLPIVFSMLVLALYNIVDSIFVARLGEDALAAVGLVFPIQNLIISVASGTSIGVNSVLGRYLGERNVKGANRVAVNGIFLLTVSWVVFALFGILGSGFYIRLYAENAQILSMGISYMQIITVGSVGVFLGILMERLLQATGRSMYSMASQLTGAVVNIVLDPIFIFGWFGMPAMGVAGAALATVIGQWLGMFVGVLSNRYRNPELQIKLRGFRPDISTIKRIYQVGAPSIIMQSIGSVMLFGMNKILIGYGVVPVSVLSVYFKLQSFVLMPIFGFTMGLLPIVSFNYGAKNKERIRGTIIACQVMCFFIMLTGTVVFWAIPELLMSMFDAQEEMMRIGVMALRLISLGFIPAGVSIVCSTFFQAIGSGIYSLMLSIIRQLVAILPIAYLLSSFYGLDAIWWAFPIAEVICCIWVMMFLKRIWKTKIKYM